MDVGRLIWSLVAKLSKLDRQTTTTGLSVPLGLHLLADQLMSGSEIKQITDWAAGCSCSFVFRWNEPYKKKVKLKTRDRIWRVPLHSLISLVSIVRSFVLLIVRATVHYPFSCGCLWSSHLIYLLLQYQQREREIHFHALFHRSAHLHWIGDRSHGRYRNTDGAVQIKRSQWDD